MSTYDLMPGPCPGFVWIGQGLEACDRCSKPYWEHTHEEIKRRRDGTYRLLRRAIPRVQAQAIQNVNVSGL